MGYFGLEGIHYTHILRYSVVDQLQPQTVLWRQAGWLDAPRQAALHGRLGELDGHQLLLK